MAERLSPRVLVLGGTRGTGREIVRRLLHDGYRVRVLARDPAAARETLDPAVEVVAGDVTKRESLPGAMADVDHLIFTAGVTQRPAGEALMRATNYDGIRNTLAACRDAGFQGRFLYMTVLGVTRSSLAAWLLNLVKSNTLKWRRLAEEEIRGSGLDYTIVRAGILTNAPGGRRAIEVTTEDPPLAFRHKISREDVAELFVQALKHRGTRRTTFGIFGGTGSRPAAWDVLFGALKPDG
jgi:uncharacterized protein YbjT (DUF2867 family)